MEAGRENREEEKKQVLLPHGLPQTAFMMVRGGGGAKSQYFSEYAGGKSRLLVRENFSFLPLTN